LASAGPLTEVPADIVIPDAAVADPGEHARFVPESYKAKVAELAARFDLSPTLIEALVWQESRWRANAVSPVGLIKSTESNGSTRVSFFEGNG
jgi:soluble lytic murein transglycosylase-like protein